MYQYIPLSASLPVRQHHEAGQVVASCPLLKATGHGRTAQAALKHLKDAIALKIQVWMEKGQLPEVLRSYGFQPIVLGGREHWVAFGEWEGCHRWKMTARLRIKKVQRAPLEEVEQPLPVRDIPWYIASGQTERPWAA